MIEKPMDRRVRRTRRIIREALLALILEKPVEKVTTTELCARADINRNTFYAHYPTPEAVLHEVEDEMLAEMEELLGTATEGEGVTEPILAHIAHRADTYRVLWRSPNSRLSERQIDLAMARVTSLWGDELPRGRDEVELFLRFAISGNFAVVRAWLEDGCRQPVGELCDMLDKFVAYGRRGLEADTRR